MQVKGHVAHWLAGLSVKIQAPEAKKVLVLLQSNSIVAWTRLDAVGDRRPEDAHRSGHWARTILLDLPAIRDGSVRCAFVGVMQRPYTH